MKTHVIISTPHGKQFQYATVDMKANDIEVVSYISFDSERSSVTITMESKDKRAYKVFVGMPFVIETWD